MAAPDRIRLDKWLVFARVVKSRSIARELVERGGIRVNRDKVRDGSSAIGPGDVLTIAYGGHIRVLRLLAVGERRGSADEAKGLYEDLAPDAVGKIGTMP